MSRYDYTDSQDADHALQQEKRREERHNRLIAELGELMLKFDMLTLHPEYKEELQAEDLEALNQARELIAKTRTRVRLRR